MLSYPAKIVRDKREGGYRVSFVDFDNIFTDGETLEEAIHNAEEALNCCSQLQCERNKNFPSPSRKKGRNIYQIHLAPPLAVAIILRHMRGKLSTAEIAKKTGINEQSYKRLENPCQCNPTIKTLEKIAKFYNKNLTVDFKMPNQN
ncbi:MAG: type II toxin-antitoxin system HicB family antitoxin [Candidatus Margulisbacteria bacterium]|nr:type II toxin-antitoxin system HicB family antitoxin [Candidatus Margulisiibacteriota bacterium]